MIVKSSRATCPSVYRGYTPLAYHWHSVRRGVAGDPDAGIVNVYADPLLVAVAVSAVRK